ncbi:ecdysteroid kinase domain-containing protein [Ditylenchus destructor]|uniref:Ecdysteroid kinase domain-containing protein n=1 Tax=Ditylenchus destructor TaxID=166010 RepID=A0AAD4R323_9BILA|nr:ecdysteroid kinase domain-containing protein [Ditylenchus destructor]
MTVDLERSIPETNYKLQFIIDTLDSKDEKFSNLYKNHSNNILKVDIRPIHGGLMSTILRIHFFFGPEDCPNFSVVFKVPTTRKVEEVIGTATNDAYIFGMKNFLFDCHNSEVRFYNKISLLMNEVKILPIIYAAREAPDIDNMEVGFILMEDIVNVKMVDIATGLTKEQVESAIRVFASFHALSLTFPDEVLNQFYFSKFGYFDDDEIHLSERLCQLPTDYFRNNKEALLKFIKVHNRVKTDVHSRLGIRPMLIHGDAWSNNVFYDLKAQSKVHAIIDWQLVHPSTGVNDILRFVYNGVTSDMRTHYMDTWIKLYFDVLQKEAKERGVESQAKYSPELMAEMLHEQKPFEIMFSLVLIPPIAERQSPERRDEMLERISTLFEEHLQENCAECGL